MSTQDTTTVTPEPASNIRTTVIRNGRTTTVITAPVDTEVVVLGNVGDISF